MSAQRPPATREIAFAMILQAGIAGWFLAWQHVSLLGGGVLILLIFAAFATGTIVGIAAARGGGEGAE